MCKILVICFELSNFHAKYCTLDTSQQLSEIHFIKKYPELLFFSEEYWKPGSLISIPFEMSDWKVSSVLPAVSSTILAANLLFADSVLLRLVFSSTMHEETAKIAAKIAIIIVKYLFISCPSG